jgi:hypothetical protein
MQWWNDFSDWFNSSEGSRVVSTMALPFLAILVAGVIAALVARGSISRLLSRQEARERASAIEALIAVGEKASQWSGLPGHTRDHFEGQASVASIRVRLLPATGAAMASAWAEYQLAEIKRDSANFSVQADQGYAEYRDRLIDWHHRPSRARRLFLSDLDRFRADSASVDTALIEKQRRWKSEQATAQQPDSATATVYSSAPPAPAPAPVPPVTPARAAAIPTPAKTPEPAPSNLVPPASSRRFVPSAPTAPAPTTATSAPGTGSTEVIEATIDDDTHATPVVTRAS